MPETGDHRSQVRAFLSTRRARLSPAQAGVPLYGGQRRVAGLRREEVAQLAGVSTDYYARLERGDLAGASQEVLDALARALHLDDAEHAHLHDLARTASTSSGAPRRQRAPRRTSVRPSLLRTLEAITDAPAFVVTTRRDVLAANRLGRALYAPMYTDPTRPVNTARFAFLDPAAREFFADWERTADDTVANLRTDAGRHPNDRALSDLIGELATHSQEFAVRWARHDVRHHHSGTKAIHHPLVGDLVLSYEVMVVPADPDQSLVTYTAEPDTAAADGLRLLASWAATTEAEQLSAPAAAGVAAPGARGRDDARTDDR